MSDRNLFRRESLWEKTADDEHLWELVGNLQSPNPEVRGAAQVCLVEAGPRSIQLVQAAVASGLLPGAIAADCIFILWDCLSSEYHSEGVAPATLT